MPVLRNNRHEAFAQAIAKGLAARTAYKAAGHGASDKAAEACASRLLTDVKVVARVLELQSKAARKVEVTVERIACEPEETRVLAIAEKQSSAAVAASMGKAKLFGLIVEKRKHSGSIGTYDSPSSQMTSSVALRRSSVRLPTLAEIRAERRRREQERDRERLARDVETIRTGCTTLVRPGGSPSHHLGFQACVAKIEMA